MVPSLVATGKGPLLTELSPVEKDLPTDKPLPSPPLLRFSDHDAPSNSLLDATEKPLRRSPPGKPAHVQEDWPVLFPERPTTPATLRRMATQVNDESLVERYPKLTPRAFSEQQPHEFLFHDTRPASGSLPASAQKILRKPVLVRVENPLERPTAGLSQDLLNGSDMSASAAALEKANADTPRNFSHPRQTRTSSLRARISAGALSTEGTGGNKVVGFTDFTTVKENPESITYALSPPPPISGRLTSSTRRQRSLRARPSLRELPHPNTLGGAHRLELQRQLSRSGARVIPHDPTKSRGRPSSTTTRAVEVNSLKSRGALDSKRTLEVSLGRSFIPVPRQGDPPKPGDVDLLPSNARSQPNQADTDDGFKIFEDRPDSSLVVQSDTPTQSDAKDADEVVDGGATERFESLPEAASPSIVFTVDGGDARVDRIKRLSKISPSNGAMLKISASAERVIMGVPGAEKEISHVPKHVKKIRDLHRAVVTNELRKASKENLVRLTPEKPARPRSTGSQYDLHLRAGPKPHEKGTKHRSADAEQMLLTTGANDPFLDPPRASSDLAADSNCPQALVEQSHGEPIPQENLAVGREALGTGEAPQSLDMVGLAYESASRGSVPNDVQQGEVAHSDIVVPSAAAGNPVDVFLEIVGGDAAARLSLPGGEGGTRGCMAPDSTAIIPSQSHDDLPPRSSSRVRGDDFTAKTPLNLHGVEASSRLSKDFSDAQNKHGSANGKLSTPDHRQVEGEKRASHHTSTSSKRSSHGSASRNKTLLSMSNLRGFFRKGHDESPKAVSTPVTTPMSGSKLVGSGANSPNSVSGNSRSLGDRSHSKPKIRFGRSGTPATIGTRSLPSSPTVDTPSPNDIARTTSLAMEILTSARQEEHSPRKERLLEMGKVMVDAITNARDAEKAMEQAKMSADKAEMAYMMTRKSVLDVARLVKEWRDAM
ncbi:MAG: hypothetical protein M1838_001599 [Thelocarpon superellum]|nr:MAG: hypothetical protein M1838_001599 [Thelocarpon superellum]